VTGGPPPLRAVWLGTVAYPEAWEAQRHLAQLRRRGDVDDCVLLLEHPPVYTMGRNGSLDHVPGGPERLHELGADYHEVDRGGSVTFHGPGQLVAYPIVLLSAAFPVVDHPAMGDVGRYLRRLEEALCATAADWGVAAAPRPPHTGAWAGSGKLAAIGVKLAGGVTTHGVALNVATDLAWFDRIVPCGIAGAGVTSLIREGADAALRPEMVAPGLASHLAEALGRAVCPADERLRRALGDLARQLPAAA
jgi:lipoate-protein ligase B